MVIKTISQIQQDEHNSINNSQRVSLIANFSGLGDYFTNSLDDYTTPNITYVGKEKADGTYLIMKLDGTNGLVITGATIINNGSQSNYSNAWTNRTSLTYNNIGGIIQ